MKLRSKTPLNELRIDERGVFASHYARCFCWKSIVGVIGYRKRTLLGLDYCIGIALQGENSEILHCSPLVTRNIWKYQYFLESMVRHLIDQYRAAGGKTWCARPLNTVGDVIEDNDLYLAYVLCRILADRLQVPWFDHTQDEEEAVASIYLSKRLAEDGTEYKQLSDAIEKTRFAVQEDGSMNVFMSRGYRILDSTMSAVLAKSAEHTDPADAA